MFDPEIIQTVALEASVGGYCKIEGASCLVGHDGGGRMYPTAPAKTVDQNCSNLPREIFTIAATAMIYTSITWVTNMNWSLGTVLTPHFHNLDPLSIFIEFERALLHKIYHRLVRQSNPPACRLQVGDTLKLERF